MKKSLFGCLLIFLISPQISLLAQMKEPDSIDVYLVKENWHTGIMFRIDDYTSGLLPALKYFKDYQYIDIGWGDADFYQIPGFDLFLAAKAILIPTPTVMRFDGYKFPIEKIIEWREFALKFELPKERFLLLINYIQEHLILDEKGETIISKHDIDSPVYFFKSKGEYHLFRTCNTWAAQALKSTGIDVDTFGLITAGQLYSRFAEYAKVLKRYD
ncbi:MAG TPA: DUF2459 domain-containing protein [Melioribacteraceae bacterium]|nr:DUF2459 domain-containing protein [Melioribacteraceae bacterium]